MNDTTWHYVTYTTVWDTQTHSKHC